LAKHILCISIPSAFCQNTKKTAVIPQQSETFKVINAETGEEVFSENAQAPKYQQDVDKKIWIPEFSYL
jgi:hypothetical protein